LTQICNINERVPNVVDLFVVPTGSVMIVETKKVDKENWEFLKQFDDI